jgi:hypothetical protein
MTSSSAVKPVDMQENCRFSLPPEQLRFRAFEKRLDQSVNMIVSFAALQRTQTLGPHRFLIIVGAILVRTIGLKMDNLALDYLAVRWLGRQLTVHGENFAEAPKGCLRGSEAIRRGLTGVFVIVASMVSCSCSLKSKVESRHRHAESPNQHLDFIPRDPPAERVCVFLR